MGKLVICGDCGERFEIFQGERLKCPECGWRGLRVDPDEGDEPDEDH